MITLHKAAKSYLAEIFQSVEVKFAYVNKIDKDNYKQIHTPVKCRDFLGDCIWSKHTKQQAYIYSFSFSFKKTPFDARKLRLSITFPNLETKNTFINNMPLLHSKEKQANTTKSTFLETQEDLTIILESASIWQKAVWKISLFSYYLKLMCYKDQENLQKPENEYALILTPGAEAILLSKIKTEKKEYLADSINHAHNYSGFISILKNQNTEMNSLLFGKT